MHPLSVAAWIGEVEPWVGARTESSSFDACRRGEIAGWERDTSRPRKKVCCDVRDETVGDEEDVDVASHGRDMSRLKNRCRFLEDVDSYDDMDDADRFVRGSACSITDFVYEEALSDELVEDDDDLQACLDTQSNTQSQASDCSTGPKITSLWNVGNGVVYTHLANTTASKREQLGKSGFALLEKLEDVGYRPVVPAKLKQKWVEADMGKVKQHQFDTSDERPVDELLWELRTIQDIMLLSQRCADNRDHETEWNNRVHTKVLELALGNDESSVGFRSVTAARITPEYRPTHSNNLTAGRIVDYAIHLEPSGPACNVVSSLIGMSTDSINHVGYESLRARPIAVSIETMTESRSVEEAKVQLGVWVAAQVARIEALVGLLAPNPSGIISHTVFPLINVQSEVWSLFFARVTPSNTPHADSRKPVSRIQIFHSVPLGNTVNTVQTYRLVKSLKVLRDWVDGDFRKWWDGVLGVGDADAGGG